MKGAIAELLASTSSTPKRTSVITIGASQYFLFCFMNCQSSLITWTFDIATPSKHLFVMARILLPFGIGNPVRITSGRATIQRVPSEQAFYETDRRDYAEKD